MKKLEAKNGKIDYPKLTNITGLIESDPYYPFKVCLPVPETLIPVPVLDRMVSKSKPSGTRGTM